MPAAAEALEDGTVWLSWRDRSQDEVGFNLQRAEGGGAFLGLASPRTDVTFHIDDTVRPGSVSGLDLAPRGGGAPLVRLLLACGADGGGHAAEWEEVKPGAFRFVAPK